MTLKESADHLAAKQAELDAIRTAYKNEDGTYKSIPMEVIEDMRARDKELNDLGDEMLAQKSIAALEMRSKERIQLLDEMGKVRGVEHETGDSKGANGNGEALASTKSWGELFTEGEYYKAAKGKHGAGRVVYREDLDAVTGNTAVMSEAVKTTMTTAAGWAPENRRQAFVVPFAIRRPVVADLIPQVDVSEANAIRYMEITTFTNNAAPTSENSAKPESAIAASENTQNIEVVATYLPATNQQLDDVPQVRSLIDNSLRFMLALAEETQLLSGNGTTPQLLGFYNKPNILTQARGADSSADAVFKAMQKIRSQGFAEPTGTIMHNDNWTPIRLATTADGIYLWGPPSEPGPERLWGLPVIQTPAATAGTGLTGDFVTWSEIFRRMGVTIEVGFINDDLIKNKRTVLCEERLALVIKRAKAFCTVTSLT